MHPVFFAELQFYDMLIASDSLSHATANNTLNIYKIVEWNKQVWMMSVSQRKWMAHGSEMQANYLHKMQYLTAAQLIHVLMCE